MLLKNDNIKVSKKDIFVFTSFYVFVDLINVFLAQYFNKKAIDYLSLDNTTLEFGLFILFIFVLFNCSHLLIESLELKIVEFKLLKTANKEKEKAYNYTLNHSMNYFNNSFSGDISSKISNISKHLKTLITSIAHIINNIVFFIVAFIFYAMINIYVALSFLISAIIFLFICEKYSKELSNKAKTIANKESQYFGFVNDVFQNIVNVKSFSNTHLEKCSSNRHLHGILLTRKGVINTQIRVQILNSISTFILFFSVISISSILLSKGKIASGDFVAIIIIIHIERFSLKRFMKYINDYYSSMGTLHNSTEKLYQPIEIEDTTKEELKIIEGKIVFNNITFGYEK